MDNTKKALEKFGKYLVKESRKNLTRKKKNVTSSLYDSLYVNEVVSLYLVLVSASISLGNFQRKRTAK